jgi:hypothetical protein
MIRLGVPSRPTRSMYSRLPSRKDWKKLQVVLFLESLYSANATNKSRSTAPKLIRRGFELRSANMRLPTERIDYLYSASISVQAYT